MLREMLSELSTICTAFAV